MASASDNQTVRLIVKGTPADAYGHAMRRLARPKGAGIVVLSASSLQTTTLKASEVTPKEFEAIVEWFLELSTSIPGYGLPVGTLLLYALTTPEGFLLRHSEAEMQREAEHFGPDI